jgi:hypothetical protein
MLNYKTFIVQLTWTIPLDGLTRKLIRNREARAQSSNSEATKIFLKEVISRLSIQLLQSSLRASKPRIYRIIWTISTFIRARRIRAIRASRIRLIIGLALCQHKISKTTHATLFWKYTTQWAHRMYRRVLFSRISSQIVHSTHRKKRLLSIRVRWMLPRPLNRLRLSLGQYLVRRIPGKLWSVWKCHK